MALGGPRPYTQNSNSPWGLPTLNQARGKAFYKPESFDPYNHLLGLEFHPFPKKMTLVLNAPLRTPLHPARFGNKVWEQIYSAKVPAIGPESLNDNGHAGTRGEEGTCPRRQRGCGHGQGAPMVAGTPGARRDRKHPFPWVSREHKPCGPSSLDSGPPELGDTTFPCWPLGLGTVTQRFPSQDPSMSRGWCCRPMSARGPVTPTALPAPGLRTEHRALRIAAPGEAQAAGGSPFF